jgi:hypothetical protein
MQMGTTAKRTSTVQNRFSMNTKQVFTGAGLIMLMAGLLLSPRWSPCWADEIVLKEQGVHTGTVLEEDEQTVTIRFPREAIQSIVKDPEEVHSTKETQSLESVLPAEEELQESIEQLQERVERLEKNREQGKEAVESSVQGTAKSLKTHEELLVEEMGRVEGVIAWRGKPLNNGRVKIVLQKYTGFSIAALKEMFKSGKDKAAQQGVILETQADSHGRYSFVKVPPGSYRLYWHPAAGKDWVRRLREKPDFEVIPGKLTVQNIPGKKAIGKGI